MIPHQNPSRLLFVIISFSNHSGNSSGGMNLLHLGTEVWSSCVRFVIGLPVGGSDSGELEYGKGDWEWIGGWLFEDYLKRGTRV